MVSRGGIQIRRQAAFEVKNGDQSVEITATRMPGDASTLLLNVNRWRGQIQLAPASEAELAADSEKIDIDGASGTYVQLIGAKDAILGVVAGSEELLAWIRGYAILHGAVASPFDAMNGLRGLRTLPVRLRQQTETATALAAMLEAHTQVDAVFYPGLPSHPQYELGRRQLDTPGGLVTFDLAGGRDAGNSLVKSVEIAQLATSLGGPETLVTHPASTTHVGLLPKELEAAGISEGTVRVSCGLEYTDDVLADFSQALDAIV